MLSGAMWSASAMVGTAVLRMVESSDSMKNATATSQGRIRLTAELCVSTEGFASGISPASCHSHADELHPGEEDGGDDAHQREEPHERPAVHEAAHLAEGALGE